jgi:hypothetical protein
VKISTKQLWRALAWSVLAFWVVCFGSFAVPIGADFILILAGTALLAALAATLALLIRLRRARWREIKLEGQLTSVVWQQAIFWMATAGLLVLLYIVGAMHYLAFIFRLIT